MSICGISVIFLSIAIFALKDTTLGKESVWQTNDIVNSRFFQASLFLTNALCCTVQCVI